MKSKQIYILDTTLRDGQQSPGAGMSFANNLYYAMLANKLKIDILESGFPSASKNDFDIVQAISKELADIQSPMVISALCQLREEQLYKTMDALAASLAINRARIHMYVPVDPELMAVSLGKLADDKAGIIANANKMVSIAYKAGFEVQLSPEGYSRQGKNFDFTTDLISSAIEAGASVINCPDTIGGASRYEEDYFLNKIKQHSEIMSRKYPNKNVTWSIHCHNDLGTALDNTLNGVFSGIIGQIEGCINGVGERAGNASLEQCIMNIRQFGFGNHLAHKVFTNIDISYLQEVSDFIAEHMLPRQPHSPIVGDNATTHTSGGHVNAILKNPLAYQPFDPAEIGGEITFVFGPLSGSNHARQIILKHGYVCDDHEKVVITQAIKDYYHDRRKGITNEELLSAYKVYREPIKVDKISYAKDNDSKLTALTLHGKFFDQQDVVIEYYGNGSALNALSKTLEELIPNLVILDYNARSQSDGRDASCHSHVVVSAGRDERYIGSATDNDIEFSAIKALIAAANNVYIDINYKL